MSQLMLPFYKWNDSNYIRIHQATYRHRKKHGLIQTKTAVRFLDTQRGFKYCKKEKRFLPLSCFYYNKKAKTFVCKCSNKISRPNRMRYSSKITDHKRNLKKKQMILNYYSKGKICCNLCGQKGHEFLNIDHVDNKGSEHRKTIGGGGSGVYNWIIKNNYPAGFQILCWNCNMVKYHFF